MPVDVDAAVLVPVHADNNNVSSLPAAVPVPVPVEDERRPLLAMLVDVQKPPPASSPPVAGPWTMVVFLWGLLNAVVFIAMNTAFLILSVTPTPCTKVWFLLCGELLCSAAAAAALAVPLQMLLTTRTTTTSRPRWAAAVHALAWVALAATVGMHCMKVASDRTVLAADPENTVHVVAFGYICLAVDLLFAGVLLISCSPRRL